MYQTKKNGKIDPKSLNDLNDHNYYHMSALDIYSGVKTNQTDYDNYNNLIFSSETNIFFKMVMRISIFDRIKHLHGDIVECGVFKGSGMMLWLKLLYMNTPHDIRKVIGFDFFDKSFADNLENDVDRKGMNQVFTRCNNLLDSDISVSGITTKFINAGISPDKFELIQGDLSITTNNYIADRPGFRISLIYLDVDLEEPTYDALCNLWDRVVIGGIVVFDEYAYHIWSESNGVDRFVKEHNLVLHKTDIKSPTAYIVKTSYEI